MPGQVVVVVAAVAWAVVVKVAASVACAAQCWLLP